MIGMPEGWGRTLAAFLGWAALGALAQAAQAACRPVQDAPYPALPCVGIHGNARNDSTVPCPFAN